MAYRQMYINGIGSGTYGIYIGSDSYLNSPSYDYTEYAVPGRMGALIQDNKRLNNIIRKFTCFIPENVATNIEGFKKLLYASKGYMRISSDYDPDTYQYGYLVDELVVSPFMAGNNLQATFDINFSCQPQRFFNTNTPGHGLDIRTERIQMILTRNDPIVQQTFADIPVSDIPKNDAYLLYLANGSDNSTAVTSITATVTEIDSLTPLQFDGFIAAIFAEYDASLGYVYDSFIEYTATGSISDTNTHSPISDANVYLLIPADTVGTINSTVVRGATTTRSENAQPCVTINRAEGHGLSYALIFSHDTLNSVVGSIPATFYMRGRNSISGETTFGGVISFDGEGLYNHFGTDTEISQGQSFYIDMEFDSDTFSADAKRYGTSDWQSANAYVGVNGTIDGMCDTLDVFYYAATLDFSPLGFDISPRWYTI